jgi:hypothetical protein
MNFFKSHTGSKIYWYVICFVRPTAIFKISSLIISRTEKDFSKRFFNEFAQFEVSLTHAPKVELEIWQKNLTVRLLNYIYMYVLTA